MKITTELSAALADIASAFHHVLCGAPQDLKRHANTPVSFWHKPTPTADVPPKKIGGNVVELDTSLYTEAEIMAMSDDVFRQKIGCLGIESREQAVKKIAKSGKGNATEITL